MSEYKPLPKEIFEHYNVYFFDMERASDVRNLISKMWVENQQLKQELEKIQQPQIFIDTEDMEERYGEQLYQEYLKQQLDLYKSVLNEVRNTINNFDEEVILKSMKNYLLSVLDKVGGSNE